MNEEEREAWQIRQSDISVKISHLFSNEELSPSKGIEILVNCITTTLIALKYQIPEESLIEIFDACVEGLKEEFKDKMEFFKSKPDINDVLAEVLFHKVTKGKK